MTKRKRQRRERDENRPGRSRLRSGWCIAILVAAAVCAYATSFDGAFLLDDGSNIVRNDSIRSLRLIDEVLSHGRRPVVNLSLAINYAFGELKVWGYHGFNLAVHILAGLTLFGVIRRTLLLDRFSQNWKESSAGFALACALLWTAHPLQTQSVTYVIQRSESMMGLFYLLTLYCVIRGHTSRRPWPWYAASVAACVLGMGSKAVMVTAPVVVLIYDRVFLADSWPQVLRRRFPLYLGLMLSWGVLVGTGVVQGVLLPPEGAQADVGFAHKDISPWDYLLTQSQVILHYLWLAIWPQGLCIDYGWPVVKELSRALVPAAIILSLLGLTVWRLWRRSWLGFVGAWFFIILAPTSSFIPIKDVAFEHRMYLPLAAVVVIVVALVKWAIDRATQRRVSSHGLRKGLAAGLLIGVAAALTVRTALRNRDYHSAEAMWRSVLTQRPENTRAHYNLGHALMSADKDEEAIAAYRRALELYPDHVSARYNMGQVLLRLGRYVEAIDAFERVVRIDPSRTYQSWKPHALTITFAQAHNSRGSALMHLGRVNRAIQAYREALLLVPGFSRAYYNLGIALARTEDYDEAIKAFQAALQSDPRYAAAHTNLGSVFFSLGRLKEAEEHFRAAIAIDDQQMMAQYNLGSLLREQGRLKEALPPLAAAAKLAPQNSIVQEALRDVKAELQTAESP